VSSVDRETGETADPPPDEADLEAGADFVGDYEPASPAQTDTAKEGT